MRDGIPREGKPLKVLFKDRVPGLVGFTETVGHGVVQKLIEKELIDAHFAYRLGKAAVKGLGNITPEHIGSKGNQGFTGVLLSRFDFDIKDLGKRDKDFQRMLAFGIADENFLFE